MKRIRRIWTDTDFNLLKELCKNNTSKECILEKINKPWNSIGQKMYYNNLYHPENQYGIKNINKENVIKLYLDNKSILEISNIFNCDYCTIWNILTKAKIIENRRKSKYSINESYFEEIDTENKAYILGLLYADGYINEKSNLLTLSLQEKDIDILIKINVELQYNKPLLFKDFNKIKHNFKNPQNQFSLNFSSKKLIQDLIKLGCKPKKSLILEFPTEEQVPSHLIHHFMRGYFDGDGCICINKNKKNYAFSLIGTLDFISKYQEILINCLNLPKNKISSVKNSYLLTYGGRLQIIKIKEWLYKNSDLYIERKFNKFLEVFN